MIKVPEFYNNIKYFSNDEMDLFEKFLLSPYFNTSTSLSVVFGIIKNNVKILKEKKYDELKSVIVRESKYSKKTVGKSLSYLDDMFAEFIKIEGLKKEKFYADYFGCRYLLLKGNYRSLDKGVNKINQLLSNQEYFDHDLFLYLYNFNALRYDDISTSENKLDTLSKLDKEKEYTLESSKNLLIYTLAKTTENFVEYVIQCSSSGKKTNRKYPVNLESMFSFIKSSEFKSYDNLQKNTVLINFKLYRLFSNLTNDRYYHDYKDIYNKIKDLYNNEFRNTHMSILMNYCFLRYRVEDKEKYYLAEGHRILYDYIDGRHYINENTEYLHSTIYRNYVVYCTTKDRKDLLKKFIDNHTGKLNPAEIKTMKDFAMAHYYYANGQNDLSLKFMTDLTNAKFFYKFDIIFLKIKIYYEIRDLVNLENIIQILKNNLRTEVIFNKAEIEKYEYLVYCLTLLVKAHRIHEKTQDVFDFEYLLKKIESKQSFALRIWLRENVTAFIKEHKKT